MTNEELKEALKPLDTPPDDGFYTVWRDGLERDVEVKCGWVEFCIEDGQTGSMEIDGLFENWTPIAPFQLPSK